jgi:hypothetical protein
MKLCNDAPVSWCREMMPIGSHALENTQKISDMIG